jgi:hypothetical protein
MYSASDVDSATVGCFLDCNEMHILGSFKVRNKIFRKFSAANLRQNLKCRKKLFAKKIALKVVSKGTRSKNIPSSQIGHYIMIGEKIQFDLITGKAAKGLVAVGKKDKKSDAYKSLADYVNQ